jgi:hypothetical protein
VNRIKMAGGACFFPEATVMDMVLVRARIIAISILDEFVKSRHTGENRCPENFITI